MPLTEMTVAQMSEGYKQHFEIVPAFSNELKWHNYHLRHEVYCHELGFEPEHADEIETDDYDRRSVHCLIRAVATQQFIGCARIVRTDPADPHAPLPFEEYCGETLDRSIIDPSRLDRSRIGEISRLALIAQYRRRQGEQNKPFSLDNDTDIAPTQGKRVRLPYLTLGLYLALIALAERDNIKQLFLLTEPSLASSISRLGVEVKRIGNPVEHRGTRVPCVIDVDMILANMPPIIRPFYEMICKEVEDGIRAQGVPV